MPGWYVLNDRHEPVPEPDLVKAAAFFGGLGNRRVMLHEIGESCVSTVFLGLDHNFYEGNPILFETLVQGGPLDGHQERYHTWDESVAGHFGVLRLLAEKLGLPLSALLDPQPEPVPDQPDQRPPTLYDRLLEDEDGQEG